MTTHFPDVSNHQPGLSLAGAAACIAKASEGVTFTDREYSRFKAEALAMGIPFAAYHWLHAADVPGQARHAFSIVGPDVPLMIDDEDTGDGLSIPRTLAFMQAYRELGGTVTLEYLPRWFWSGHGSPDLRPLAAAGLSIVSSNYTAYSDSGPGWLPYGGVTPAIWQYTSTAPFNGQLVDFNAYKGTVSELRALFNGTSEGDMEQSERLEQRTGWDGMTIGHVFADLENLRAVLYYPPGAAEVVAPFPSGSVGAMLVDLVSHGLAPIDVAELAAAIVADPGFRAALDRAAFEGAQRAERE